MEEELLDVIKRFRGDATSKELVQEYYDNLNNINYLEFLTSYPQDTLMDNCVKSYFMKPGYNHVQRKSFVLGMCFFQTSEMLDQCGLEREVKDIDDFNELLDYRIKDFKYLLEGKNSSLSNKYSIDGIICEAKDYYGVDSNNKTK